MIPLNVSQGPQELAATLEHSIQSGSLEPQGLIELLDRGLRGVHPTLGLVHLGLASAQGGSASIDLALE